MRDVKFWLAIVPVVGITVEREGNKYWIDRQLLKLIEGELGDKTVLVSSGLWNSWLGYNFVKKDEKIFADSGGFQFYFLTYIIQLLKLFTQPIPIFQ